MSPSVCSQCGKPAIVSMNVGAFAGGADRFEMRCHEHASGLLPVRLDQPLSQYKMTDFATTLRAAIVADPEQSRRGRRVVSIIDAPDSPWRTRHLQRWEAAVRHKYGASDEDDVDWPSFWTILGRIATVLSILIMLLPFLSEAPGESDMATPAQIDELKTKLQALADSKYGGDPAKVFSAYAGPDDLIDAGGLYKLLSDAGVGSGITRRFWASGIMDALDANHDGKLSRDEIKAAASGQQHVFGGSLSIYGYLTITGAAIMRVDGAEADAKKLYKPGTRLLRFSSGMLSRSLEEFDGTGWQSCPIETL